MKKTSLFKSALVLVLALVLSVFPLAGCKKKVKTPMSYFETALNNSINEAKNNKITSFVNNVCNGGSIELSYKDNASMPMLYSDFSLYAYLNDAESKYYCDLDISDDTGDHESKIYITKDAAAFDIAGMDDIFGIDIKNFKENFKNSALNTDNFNIDALYELIDNVEKAISSLKNKNSVASESFKKNANVTGEQTDDNKYVVHVELDSNAIAAVIKEVYDSIAADESFKEAISNIANSDLFDDMFPTTEDGKSFDEEFSDFLDQLKNGKLDVKLDITFDKDDSVVNEVVSIDCDFNDNGDANNAFKGNIQISSSSGLCNITAKADITSDGEVTSVEYTGSQKYSDGEFYMEIGCKMTPDEETLVDVKVIVDYKNDEYTLSVEMMGGEDDNNVKLNISGILKISDDELNASIEKISFALMGFEMSYDMDITLKVKAKADETMPDMPEYKDITSLSEDEINALFGDIIGGNIDDDDFDYSEDSLEWPYERLSKEVPEFDVSGDMIYNITDMGSALRIDYFGYFSETDIEDYITVLKSFGFTNEKELDNAFAEDMLEYSCHYQASNDAGYGVGVYFSYDYDIAIVVYIPEDRIENYGFSSDQIDAPDFGTLESVQTTLYDIVATYSGVSAADINEYEAYIKSEGFVIYDQNNYDSLGEYNFTAKNSENYTVTLAAESDKSGNNTYNLYLIIEASVDMPHSVLDFEAGELVSSEENNGFAVWMYSNTTVEDARSYVEGLIEAGYTELSYDSDAIYEYCSGVTNEFGYEIYVYYLGDGMTGIMMGYTSDSSQI